MKIFINVSELAIITGHNRFNYLSDYIIKLYQRYFNQDYRRILKLIKEEKKQITKSESAQECIQRVVKSNNLNIENKLQGCLKSNNVQELSKKQESLQEEIAKSKTISKKDKDLINQSIKSLTNTNFGTKQENNVVQYYESIIKKEIITTDHFFVKELFKTKDNIWSIGGKIDGLFIDDKNQKVLLEVKNRVKKLFKSLRAYEKVQIYAYMKLLDINNAKLIECLKNDKSEYNVIDVKYEPEFYKNKMLNFIKSFIVFFEKIIDSDEFKIKLLTSEKPELEKWLRESIY